MLSTIEMEVAIVNKVSKIAIAIIIKIKEGTSETCGSELNEALKKEVGNYFIGAKPSKTGGAFADLVTNVNDMCVFNLIFPGNATGAIFERESIEEILDRLKMKSFDVVAVSHTPFSYVEYE